MLQALRSVELNVPDLALARAFFTAHWGLTVAQHDSSALYLRGTGRDAYLVALYASDKPSLRSVTLRANSSAALEQIASAAQAHGGRVVKPNAVVAEPGGGRAITIQDPQGRVLRIIEGDTETAVGRQAADRKESTDSPRSAANVKQIQDNDERPIRLAHVVLNSVDVAAVQPFYEQVLGMRLSDRTKMLAFLRIPAPAGTLGDHHSLAFGDADNNCLNHIAFVVGNLDAVMRGGGRLKDAGYPIQWGPGRHGPGNNLFNYFVSPFGFVLEYTAEVEQVGESYQSRGPSDWGWPAGRFDHWGISQPPSPELKQAQRSIEFARPTN